MRAWGRPSHALVVAYLALFIALGGSGYAALRVTGKNVKNGSLTGKDIKRGSIRAREVSESKLGKVPRSKTADSADRAGTAGTAASASSLAGLGPGAFLPSSRLRDGMGIDYAVPPDTIVSFPELGIAMTTDGDNDVNNDLRLVKTTGFAGNIEAIVGDTPYQGTSIDLPVLPRSAHVVFFRQSDPARRVEADCAFIETAPEVYCSAITAGF